jgi:hypothetical protein
MVRRAEFGRIAAAYHAYPVRPETCAKERFRRKYRIQTERWYPPVFKALGLANASTTSLVGLSAVFRRAQSRKQLAENVGALHRARL